MATYQGHEHEGLMDGVRWLLEQYQGFCGCAVAWAGGAVAEGRNQSCVPQNSIACSFLFLVYGVTLSIFFVVLNCFFREDHNGLGEAL